MNPGEIVIVNCVNPKEQIWGRLLRLDAAGVVVRGIDLRTFEDWARELVRDADNPSLGLVTSFTPMHRLERIFLDERVGQVPSYREQFTQLTGKTVEGVVDSAPAPAS